MVWTSLFVQKVWQFGVQLWTVWTMDNIYIQYCTSTAASYSVRSHPMCTMRRFLPLVIDQIAKSAPSSAAIISPNQQRFQLLTYQQLSARTINIARSLQELGYQRHDVLVSDLPNVAENLLLQVACSRIGVVYATAKDADALTELTAVAPQGVRGAVTTNLESFLGKASLAHAAIAVGESELSSASRSQISFDADATPSPSTLAGQAIGDAPSLSTPFAYYNSLKPTTMEEVVGLGEQAARHLSLTAADRVCVSITLCHTFGIGSACSSALLNGAAIVLPAVGGIRGCGNPAQRAEATLSVLSGAKCSLLFADTHTLGALEACQPSSAALSHLRGGVVKVGSGSDILDGTVRLANVSLATLGKK
jgi:non-ribosomal peptide synthetase component E (peptide arylation enzyme)